MHNGGVGGAERSHVEMVSAMVTAGFRVTTLIPGVDHGLGCLVTEAGGSYEVVPALEWWSRPGRDSEISSALASAPLVRVIARINPDIVITQTSVIPQGALAAAALNKPHIWFLREFGDLDHGFDLFASPKSIGALIRGLSDLVICNSESVANHYFGDDRRDVQVINPLVIAEPSDKFLQHRVAGAVGVVAGVHCGKGQEDAIRAVGVARDYGIRIPLKIIGTGAPVELNRLAVIVSELKLDDLVTFTGELNSASEIYSEIDILLVPSRNEAFGRTPWEAAKFGIPTIYANSGGIVEYMVDGFSGLSYKPGDVNGLASQLITLWKNPGLQQELAQGFQNQISDINRVSEFQTKVVDAISAVMSSYPHSPPRALIKLVGNLTMQVTSQAPVGVIPKGSELVPNAGLTSPNGRYRFVFEQGMLNLYDKSTLTHSTGALEATEVVFQNDGNFVIYQEGVPLAASNTVGTGTEIALLDSGDLVLRNAVGQSIINLVDNTSIALLKPV